MLLCCFSRISPQNPLEGLRTYYSAVDAGGVGTTTLKGFAYLRSTQCKGSDVFVIFLLKTNALHGVSPKSRLDISVEMPPRGSTPAVLFQRGRVSVWAEIG